MQVLSSGDSRRVLLSVTDLTRAAACEFAVVRDLDIRLGRAASAAVDADALADRIARVGDQHERSVLDRYRAEFGDATDGGGVLVLERPRRTVEALSSAAAETVSVLSRGVDVLAQGTVFDGTLVGHPDFVVREGGVYVVEDAKLARRDKVPALLQIAAYADLLSRAGVPVAGQAALLRGDGERTLHRLADLVPVYRDRRARLEALVAQRLVDEDAVEWGDTRFVACGRCETCAAEVAASRDLLLVAGMRMSQRAHLREAGVGTVEELAACTGPVPGVPAGTLDRLRAQATLQATQDARCAAGDLQANGWPIVDYVVIDELPLLRLPPPDPGDVFFDFEGDPLWDGDGTEWGLEYLFGVAEADGAYRAFWAHDRAGERQALQDFMAYVIARRASHPGMRIYHYASYETTALKRLAGRHGCCEDELDQLLRDGVFVDLYSTVRQSIRVSQPSYSLKYLEPLYMEQRRQEELDNAADSVVMYARAVDLRQNGDDAEADELLAAIEAYNTYDVESTRRLRDWLLGRTAPVPASAQHSVASSPPVLIDVPDAEALAARLTELADAVERDDDGPANEEDARAIRMVAATLGYHRRENKPMWWEHFHRLVAPVDDWRADRSVFVPDQVVDPVTGGTPTWKPLQGRQRSLRRDLRLVGTLPEGTDLKPGWKGHSVYGHPLPGHCTLTAEAVRAVGGAVEVTGTGTTPEGNDWVEVTERLRSGAAPHGRLPLAITPDEYVRESDLVSALVEVGRTVEEHGTAQLPGPGLDVLNRVRPRAAGGLVAVDEDGLVEGIVQSLRRLDRSYLAVQGPPGTGKTYAGARVVAALVADGWKVGVVSQSHAVVENLLAEAVRAGVPAAVVAKKNRSGDESPRPWDTGASAVPDLLSSAGGCLVGGTAWTFSNDEAVPRGALDALVIDEAGQFSLANTVAVSVSTRRLLLLGDPQQLPQVSQGTHPEPVDESALGWLMQGEATLPAELGYFLPSTYRMHPELCSLVSRLSYDDRLRSVERVTASRHLDGVAPGLHLVRVEHDGNAALSWEEVDAVERIVTELLGRSWTDDHGETRGLGQADVLVVAPYNAQVNAIRGRLAARNLASVRVGTVDKFQGQQAPVVVVSMTTSSPADVPRGMGFVLSRNRVNVAVSRAQWATYLVCSPRLTDYLPANPSGLAELGAFLGLAGRAVAAADGGAPSPGGSVRPSSPR